MFKRILIAYEGSEFSKKAFDKAIDIAAAFNAELFVLSVIQLPEPIGEMNTDSLIESATDYYKKEFSILKEKTKALNLNVHFELAEGCAAEAIVSFAENSSIDLICIGIRTRRSFLNKLVLGSVTRKVVEYAPCSVLVVKLG